MTARLPFLSLIALLFLAVLTTTASVSGELPQRRQQVNDTPPISAYLLEKSFEMKLARSAAPPAISDAAAVMVLTRKGYEYASSGHNGFVCIVQRGWMNDLQDPNFGSPELLSPMCLNPAGVRLYLPLIMKRTELALARSTPTTIKSEMASAFSAGKLPKGQPGALCYMMSRQGKFGSDGPPVPHIMFFTSAISTVDWGAGLPGSPIIGYEDPLDQLTVFIFPVRHWSDGTPASLSAKHSH